MYVYIYIYLCVCKYSYIYIYKCKIYTHVPITSVVQHLFFLFQPPFLRFVIIILRTHTYPRSYLVGNIPIIPTYTQSVLGKPAVSTHKYKSNIRIYAKTYHEQLNIIDHHQGHSKTTCWPSVIPLHSHSIAMNLIVRSCFYHIPIITHYNPL